MTWSLQAEQASIQLGSWTAVVHSASPQWGLHQIRHGRQDVPIRALQVALPARVGAPSGFDAPSTYRLADRYVRGTDLILSYEPSEPIERLAENRRPLVSQVYWRAQASGPIAVLDLLISIQTDLLESRPLLEVRTGLPGELWSADVSSLHANAADPAWEPLRTGATQPRGSLSLAQGRIVLCRIPNIDFSYAEMIHPSDDLGATWRPNSATASPAGILERRLFHEYLEKGVIRRARLRGIFVPRDDDGRLALGSYRDFLAERLPLTT